MTTGTAASPARWRQRAIARMKATRAGTLALVRGIPAPELRRPRTLGDWSVKDVLAHLLSCDEETSRRFRLIARGQAQRIRWFESMAHADRFNARSVARRRRLGLGALLGRMDRAHGELLALFDALPLRALADPSHAYTVVDWLPAPGWEHERQHMREVRAWWRRRHRQVGTTARARRRGAAAERPGRLPVL